MHIHTHIQRQLCLHKHSLQTQIEQVNYGLHSVKHTTELTEWAQHTAVHPLHYWQVHRLLNEDTVRGDR